MNAEPADGPLVELVVTGDLDVVGGPELAARIDAALADAPVGSTLVLDVGDVTFCDSQGVTALVNGYVEAGRRHVHLVLRSVPIHLRRVLQITGVLEQLEGPGTDPPD